MKKRAARAPVTMDKAPLLKALAPESIGEIVEGTALPEEVEEETNPDTGMELEGAGALETAGPTGTPEETTSTGTDGVPYSEETVV